MSRRLYFGIDGGGTKTEAVLVDETGLALGGGISGSTNRNHYSKMQIVEHLTRALKLAAGEIQLDEAEVTIFLGMSGVSTDRDRQDIVGIVREVAMLGGRARIGVENDAVAGLIGGLAGAPGMALIAGTGSICLGVNAKHEQWWAGGWGSMADDAGSAPWVGLRAMNAAVRAEDGRGKPTKLRDLVFDYLRLSEPRDLIDRVHNQKFERSEIGALAVLVTQAYVDGDVVAGEILDAAAGELSQMVSATVKALFTDEPCPLIYVGGFARSGEPFQPMLTKKIIEDSPTVIIKEPKLSPAHGAALEALRLGGVQWTPELIGRLGKKYERRADTD
jgi:N-acetylglucosamine kinase-like BadF-type ATPase